MHDFRIVAAAALVAVTLGCGATRPGAAAVSEAATGTVSGSFSGARSLAAIGPMTAPAAIMARSQEVRYTLYPIGGSGPPVLLVHGWAGQAKEMEYLAEGVKARGFSAWSIDLRPADARVADTARGLAGAIDEVLGKTGSRKLSLVCHSMGGLDSRFYLALMWGASKVDRLVTVASPHHGTVWGGFAHGEAKIDLRPGSDLIRTLDSFGKPLVPTTSIFTWTDQTVVPANSAILDGATNLPHWGLTHTTILRNEQVLDEVLQALRR